MKANLIKTELIRYARNCKAQEDFLRCKEQFWLRFCLRGYSRLWLARHFRPIQHNDRALFLRPVFKNVMMTYFPSKFGIHWSQLHWISVFDYTLWRLLQCTANWETSPLCGCLHASNAPGTAETYYWGTKIIAFQKKLRTIEDCDIIELGVFQLGPLKP